MNIVKRYIYYQYAYVYVYVYAFIWRRKRGERNGEKLLKRKKGKSSVTKSSSRSLLLGGIVLKYIFHMLIVSFEILIWSSHHFTSLLDGFHFFGS